MQKTLYEWVVLCKDEEFILTEKQHDVIIDNSEARFINFPFFTIQPSMISWMKKRPAQGLKEFYPCHDCHTTGQKHNIICASCEGTGVKLP